MEWAHKLMQQEGILAGVSCGAAMAVAHRLSQQEEHQGKMIVAILPDSGERYLTSPLFADTSPTMRLCRPRSAEALRSGCPVAAAAP